MSFNFDLTGTPPVPTDIATKREEAVSERAIFRQKNIRFMIGMATVTTIYVTFILVFVFPMLQQPEVGIIFYFFPHLTFVIFIVGNHLHIKNIEKPSNALDKIIKTLSEVDEEALNEVINDKELTDEMTSYMDRVAAQGRSLVYGEVDLIEKWYETN